MRLSDAAARRVSSGSGRQLVAVSLASPLAFRNPDASEFSAAEHCLPGSCREAVDAPEAARNPCMPDPDGTSRNASRHQIRTYIQAAGAAGRPWMSTSATDVAWASARRHRFRRRLRASTHIQTARSTGTGQVRAGSARPPGLARSAWDIPLSPSAMPERPICARRITVYATERWDRRPAAGHAECGSG